VIALVRRLVHRVPTDETFGEAEVVKKKHESGKSIRELFVPALRLDTLGLFGAFFFCLMANYIGIQLLPLMLRGVGFEQLDANGALGNWNLGGVAGALLGAFIILKLGSRIAMLGMSAAAIICAIVLTTMRIDPRETFALTIMLVLLGGLMNAVQTTMYALASNVYPTAIRGTGIGTAVAIGRIGNAMAGAVGNYALTKGGTPGYFWSFAITMTLTLMSLALVRRHIERAPGRTVAV
jgi:AAHS family 4-hydroxybenzoate transporter-like MFS transporter